MNWLYPAFWWALWAVPLVALLFWYAARQRRRALDRLGERSLMGELAGAARPWRRRAKAALVVGAVLFLAVALVGPRYGTSVREVEQRGIDLVIALDVSQSMLAEDVAPSRLERAKSEISNLLGELRGDRVGLVVFAGDAFIQCPLTTDYGAVRLFLDVAGPDLLSTPGTDFGAALQTARRAFKGTSGDAPQAEARSQALLIVSDGEDHAGRFEGVIEEARAAGITIFAAGVGERTGARIPIYRAGRRVGFKENRRGETVRTRLEEDVLQQLAQDGAYFRIARTSSALGGLPAALGRLEQTRFGTEAFESYDEKFQWPLGLALLLLAAERLVRDRR